MLGLPVPQPRKAQKKKSDNKNLSADYAEDDDDDTTTTTRSDEVNRHGVALLLLSRREAVNTENTTIPGRTDGGCTHASSCSIFRSFSSLCFLRLTLLQVHLPSLLPSLPITCSSSDRISPLLSLSLSLSAFTTAVDRTYPRHRYRPPLVLFFPSTSFQRTPAFLVWFPC